VINFGDERVVRQVTLTGGMKRNGPVEYRDGLTLIQAISSAGGPSDFAKLKDVCLIRGGKSYSYNVEELLRKPRMDPALLPNDSIIIPESGRKL
jgi:protein involved in polysaccharide export with SLBB domain